MDKQDDIDLIKLYFQEANCPVLSVTEERDLVRRMKEGDKAAHEKLCRHNLRLVISIAKRYQGQGDLTFLDLIQEGNLGLLHGLKKFRPELGYRLTTYLTPWIRQFISRSLENTGRTIRVPSHVSQMIFKMKCAREEIEQGLGRKATIEEVAERMDTSVKKVKWLCNLAPPPVSLEMPVGQDGDNILMDFVEDSEVEDPLDIATEGLLKEELDEILGSLSERNEKIVRMRFGLDGTGEVKSLKQVGDEFGITRERVRQVCLKFCRLARHPIRLRRLEGFLER